MKLQSHLALALAVASVGVLATSNASAYIVTEGERGAEIHNQTKGCVRAYIDGRTYDIAPGKTKTVSLNTEYHKPYLVSLFPTARCGGKAARNRWFDMGAIDWWVK